MIVFSFFTALVLCIDSGNPYNKWKNCRKQKYVWQSKTFGKSSWVRTHCVRWMLIRNRLSWLVALYMRTVDQIVGVLMWLPPMSTIWWRVTRIHGICVPICTKSIWMVRRKRLNPYRICLVWNVELCHWSIDQHVVSGEIKAIYFMLHSSSRPNVSCGCVCVCVQIHYYDLNFVLYTCTCLSNSIVGAVFSEDVHFTNHTHTHHPPRHTHTQSHTHAHTTFHIPLRFTHNWKAIIFFTLDNYHCPWLALLSIFVNKSILISTAHWTMNKQIEYRFHWKLWRKVFGTRDI